MAFKPEGSAAVVPVVGLSMLMSTGIAAEHPTINQQRNHDRARVAVPNLGTTACHPITRGQTPNCPTNRVMPPRYHTSQHPHQHKKAPHIAVHYAAPKPVEVQPTIKPRPTGISPLWGDFVRIAHCESGDNWQDNTGNGFSGGLQFAPQTWSSYGGEAYAPQAYLATEAQQIAVATKVQADQGWNAWPVCSRVAGVAN